MAEWLDPIGKLWTSALRAVAVPLSIMLLVTAVASAPSGKEFGRKSVAALLTFLALLVAGAVFTLALVPIYLSTVGTGVAALGSPASLEGGAFTLGDWLQSLIPTNIFEALAKGDLLQLSIIAVVFALALRTLPRERTKLVVDLFAVLRDVLLTIVRWLLVILPLGAFALAFVYASREGFSIAGAALHFVLLVCGLLFLFTILLHILATVIGQVKPQRFAISAWPSQLTAASTRSSIASLPALVESGSKLGLSDSTSALVLPLSVSVFKNNRTISSTAKLLFIAAIFGISLAPGAVATFVLTVILLSFSSPGIPSGGGSVTFPAYVAAGLPPEGVLLFEAVDQLTDVFKTITNVTADLVAALLVERFGGAS